MLLSIRQKRQPRMRLTLNPRCQMNLDIQIQRDVDPQTALLFLVLTTARLVFGGSVGKLIRKRLTSRFKRPQSLVCGAVRRSTDGTLSSIASPTQGTLGGIGGILDGLSSFFYVRKRTFAAATLWFLLFLSLGFGLRLFWRLVVVFRLVIIVVRLIFILMRSRGSLILLLFSVMKSQWPYKI